MSEVAIRPVSPDQHDAVMHYFDMVAYADNPNWSRCFCCERIVDDYESRTKEQNRTLRSTLIKSATANGLVAYRLGRVVGWCHAAPKSELLSVPGERSADVGAIVCFVVLRPSHHASEPLRNQLSDLVARQMGKALKPERVLFTRDLPKTRSAKIMRRVIRATYMGKEPGDLSSLENPTAVRAITEAS